jgi:hypothetical protein
MQQGIQGGGMIILPYSKYVLLGYNYSTKKCIGGCIIGTHTSSIDEYINICGKACCSHGLA